MQSLYVLVGVRGAGKTTLCIELRERGWQVLTPSTTRPKRSATDEEYYFVDPSLWSSRDMAWTIEVGSNKYGMLVREAERALGKVPVVTVFDPGNLEVLAEYARHSPVKIVTVGLDTIENREEQVLRVGGSVDRVAKSDDVFRLEHDRVLACDFVLRGQTQSLADGVQRIALALDAFAEGPPGT